MNLEPALTLGIIFSDMVIREQGTGKSTIVGSFSCYNLPQIPYQVAPFYTTVLLTNITPDVAALDVTARIENPQNGLVLASTAVKLQYSKPANRNDVTEVSIPIVNVAFPAPGLYKIVVLVNNEKIGERNLPVNDIRATTQSTSI